VIDGSGGDDSGSPNGEKPPPVPLREMPNVWDPRGIVPFVGEEDTILKLPEGGGGETNLGGGGERAYPPKAAGGGEVVVELSRLTFMAPESLSKPWRN